MFGTPSSQRGCISGWYFEAKGHDRRGRARPPALVNETRPPSEESAKKSRRDSCILKLLLKTAARDVAGLSSRVGQKENVSEEAPFLKKQGQSSWLSLLLFYFTSLFIVKDSGLSGVTQGSAAGPILFLLYYFFVFRSPFVCSFERPRPVYVELFTTPTQVRS